MPDLNFHEINHINKLLQQQGSLKYIFDEFVRKTGVLLTQWNEYPSGDLWSRNQRVQQSIEQEMAVLHEKLNKNIENYTSDAWNRSHLKNDELVNGFIKNLAISQTVKEGMYARNAEALSVFIKRKVDGLSLSDNIWKITGNAKQNIEFYLESGLSTGRSAALISQDIRQLLQEPDRRFHRIRNADGKLVPSQPMKDYHPGQGVYRSSYKNALRLAATNTNEMYRITDNERWNKLDFVIGFNVRRATVNYGPCPICDAMVGNYPKSYVFRGNHPFCICVATPILMDEDAFIDALVNDDFSDVKYINNIPESGKKYITGLLEEKKISTKSYILRDNGKFFDESVKITGTGNLNILYGVDKTASDYKNVFTTAKWFADKGHNVEILPRYHYNDKRYNEVFGKLEGTKYYRKSPDLFIDGKFYEHEGFSHLNPKRNFSNMLSRGLQQSPRLIIEDCGLTDRYMKRIIFKRIQDGQVIKEIWKITTDESTLVRLY